MKLRIALLCVVLVLMASQVSAFPLSGSNGIWNATIFGVYPYEGNSYEPYAVGQVIDMMVPRESYLDIVLVDSEDKLYSPRGTSVTVGAPLSTLHARLGVRDVLTDPVFDALVYPDTDVLVLDDHIFDAVRNYDRVLRIFDVPKGLDIKRVKFTPGTCLACQA
jgi:hypothetical protein